MVKVIEVEPVTRLEGHGGLRVVLDDDGKVQDVQFNITSTRFFEKFLEGRYCEHIPRITPRICGICPIPHHLTPTKAVEDAWGVKIPPAAYKLRQLLQNAKQYSSHTLHFYALAAPDFLLGPFADPALRNVVHVINKMPDVGKMALKMMDFGQKLCAAIGGKSVHPISAIVGGMKKPLDEDVRDKFLKQIEDQVEWAKKTVDIGLKVVEDYWDVVANVGVVPTYYVGMTKNGIHDIYDGDIRIVSPDGEKFDYPPQKYLDALGEHIPEHSYATHMYYKPAGYPEGIYRANTLAMTNCADKMATPLADEALQAMRAKIGNISHHTFAYHWARLIELVESIEVIATLLQDDDVVNTDCKTLDVQPREGDGVGITEAPRGLLLYHIWSDAEGICKKANLLVATNHNIAGIEKTLMHVAKQVFEDKALEGLKLPDPWIK
ncbi:MAG: Ni/Fe hydrogenase subunit alpha [Promethearchaeota archaeon Loki_b32]|nr:MAG: Ni/Fe hydrogenase subunit alpha [Candidatus Lokiarchaeota archaeon Loki_b32]